MDDEIVFGERTFQQESEYRLGLCLDAIMTAFYRLWIETGELDLNRITPIVFITEDFEYRINYYLQRTPLSAPVSTVGFNLLHNRNINNALVVLHTDAPEMKIWDIYEEIFCAFLLSRNLKDPYFVSGWGTRTHNAIKLQFGITRQYLEHVMGMYWHDCDEIVFNRMKQQGKIVSCRAVDYYSRNKHTFQIKQGELFKCNCGYQVYFDVLPPVEVLKRVPNKPLFFR